MNDGERSAAVVAALGCVVALGSCSAPRRASPSHVEKSRLEFLTRDGCANTAIMRESLDAALRSLKLPVNYEVIDLDALPDTDARSGYPTPTVLFANRDLFGVPEPPAPHPPAT